MYYEDHVPPHFHAYYGEYDATVNIRTMAVISERMNAYLKRRIEQEAVYV